MPFVATNVIARPADLHCSDPPMGKNKNWCFNSKARSLHSAASVLPPASNWQLNAANLSVRRVFSLELNPDVPLPD
jgi:hypothetical protein